MIRVDFSVPGEFEDIPIGVDFETAWSELNRRCARAPMTGEPDREKLREMARTLHQVSRLLKEVGVVYAADCLHSFQGEPSLGSLAVAVVDFPYGNDPAIAARGTLRGVLESRGPEWAGSVVDTQCGPAAVFTGSQSYTLPPVFSPSSEPVEVLTAQFHAMIPIPAGSDEDGRRMCLIAFSTPNLTHWDTCYAPMMASVLRSLRFTRDSPGDTRNDVAPPRISGETSRAKPA
ncbi:hypothetical protein [Streptomyces sp. P17]|uniref:hypothetical protein n=1 Tax=Streptomyces sp. P17 TaxID=3074716 RepID=UPI0028F43E79|nr:hypothetical protein [Streptomyces sp. P17]MDT9701322.1 hypothetical protein [Streptomyces sp. P17]